MCRPRVAISSATTASTPVSGLDGPKTKAPHHATAAAKAPNAAPTTGSAVMAPRPIGAFPARGTGSTVPNAKADARERITAVTWTGRPHRPLRRSPSTTGRPPRRAAPAAPPRRRFPRPAAYAGPESGPARAPPTPVRDPARWTGDRLATTAAHRAPGARRPTQRP